MLGCVLDSEPVDGAERGTDSDAVDVAECRADCCAIERADRGTDERGSVLVCEPVDGAERGTVWIAVDVAELCVRTSVREAFAPAFACSKYSVPNDERGLSSPS